MNELGSLHNIPKNIFYFLCEKTVQFENFCYTNDSFDVKAKEKNIGMQSTPIPGNIERSYRL